MNYDSLNEEMTNVVEIAGVVKENPVFSHEIDGEKFFECQIEIERLSKSKDIIPVTFSERIVLNEAICKGDFVKVNGEYRSLNKSDGEKSRLILYVFAKEIELSNEKKFENDVKLSGFLCKEPVYRKTPFGREICDILLAVNRTNYHKSDYVPCIIWGRNARFVSGQQVGCKMEIGGRIQSRVYSKTLEDGKTVERTAYEISCYKTIVVSNVSPISFGEKQSNEGMIG